MGLVIDIDRKFRYAVMSDMHEPGSYAWQEHKGFAHSQEAARAASSRPAVGHTLAAEHGGGDG